MKKKLKTRTVALEDAKLLKAIKGQKEAKQADKRAKNQKTDLPDMGDGFAPSPKKARKAKQGTDTPPTAPEQATEATAPAETPKEQTAPAVDTTPINQRPGYFDKHVSAWIAINDLDLIAVEANTTEYAAQAKVAIKAIQTLVRTAARSNGIKGAVCREDLTEGKKRKTKEEERRNED